jgi:hypothetical protein
MRKSNYKAFFFLRMPRPKFDKAIQDHNYPIGFAHWYVYTYARGGKRKPTL